MIKLSEMTTGASLINEGVSQQNKIIGGLWHSYFSESLRLNKKRRGIKPRLLEQSFVLW